jgi:hypothetical protein
MLPCDAAYQSTQSRSRLIAIRSKTNIPVMASDSWLLSVSERYVRCVGTVLARREVCARLARKYVGMLTFGSVLRERRLRNVRNVYFARLRV